MSSVLTPLAPPVMSSPAAGSPYVGYTYAYPHKSAYRRFDEPLPLRSLWSREDRSRLFLYLHLPFCEHRCGFCNLFTQANPEQGLTRRYLDQLRHEAVQTRDALEGARFVRCAIGGGTPTFLSAGELAELFDVIRELMGADPGAIPTGCEVSPATVDEEKLTLLHERGVDRISIGVQSFDFDEARAMGRPQQPREVVRALDLIAGRRFPTLNIDLIYGGAGQTPASFVASIERALEWQPQELFLYPLYVRPLTGLGRRPSDWDDHRLACYRAGRSRLLEAGYTQVSLRMFRRRPGSESEERERGAEEWLRIPVLESGRQPSGSQGSSAITTAINAGTDVLRNSRGGRVQTACGRSAGASLSPQDGPDYCCQNDGMVGLGCGARSYTRTVHYSSEYATSRGGVKAILADYLQRAPQRFAAAEYGHRLSLDDQRRRFLLQALLQTSGLDRAAYRARFDGDVLTHLPELQHLIDEGLAGATCERITLTPGGVERSDAIGPWLYSAAVRRLMQEYELH